MNDGKHHGAGKDRPAQIEREHGLDDARALRNYLYQMQEQLQYVLSNLDTENLSEELRTRLQKLP